MQSYAMFTPQGDAMVHKLVEQARELASVDGPVNPVELAWQWLLNELEVLSQVEGFGEATDTAVREAAYDRFI